MTNDLSPYQIFHPNSKEIQMGAREMDVMDTSGHSKHIWSSDSPDEVKSMKDLFESLTKKGYRAFHVNKAGDEGKVMKDFDPDAEKMILVPPIQGG